MGLKKRVFRCGCNNSSISLPSVNNGNRTCCQNCAGAPCFYSVMSDCDIWMPNGELLLNKCTLLRKDCINGCTWSSRWNAGNGSATIDYPAIFPEACSINRCRTVTVGPCDGPCPYDCFDLELTSISGNILEGLFGDCASGCYGLDANDDSCSCSGTATQPPPYVIRLNKTNNCGYIGYFYCITAVCSPDPLDRIVNDISYGIIYLEFGQFDTTLRIVRSEGNGAGTLQVVFDDVTCYSGSAGTGQPASIAGSGYSFSVGNDDWSIKTDPNPHTMSGTITPASDCYSSGTAAGFPDNAQSSSPYVQVRLPAYPCWWQEDSVQGGACSTIEYLTGNCGNVPPDLDRGYTGTAGTAGISNFMKWVLTLNSQTGTADGSSLVLRTREGYTATYLSTIDSCKEPNTFTLSSYDSKLKFLPPKLCVLPIESTPPLVCETGTAQCACCEDGDELFVSIVVSGCDALAGGYTGSLARISNAGSASLPCGVSYPSSAPCGIFTLGVGTPGGDDCNVGGTDWSEAIYLVFYCNGTDYSIDVYCYDNDANCWVYQGAATVTNYECKCFGPSFAFTLPAISCCCPAGVDICCCDGFPVPQSLTVSDGTNSAVATWNGSYWVTGTIPSFAGCTDGYVWLYCDDTIPESCVWYMILWDSGGFVISQPPANSTACDPLMLDFLVSGCDAGSYTVSWTE